MNPFRSRLLISYLRCIYKIVGGAGFDKDALDLSNPSDHSHLAYRSNLAHRSNPSNVSDP
jgi:hypothetical protein